MTFIFSKGLTSLRQFIIVLGAAATAFPAASVTGDTTLTAPGSVTVDFDPFDGLDGVQTLTFTATHAGSEPLPVVLELIPEIETSFGFVGTGDVIPLLIDGAGQSATLERFRLPLTLDPGTTDQEITFRIPSGLVPTAGEAYQTLSYHLLDPVTLEPITTTRALAAVASVPARAQTNFAGVSAGYLNGTTTALVDFEEIQAGDMRRIVLQVRANTDAGIDVSSENNGAMIATDSANRIDYALTVDGEACDLSTGCALTRTPERTLNGSAYPMEFTIDTDAMLMAGDYRDVVIVDVNPL